MICREHLRPAEKDLGRRLYEAWAEVMRGGTREPAPWDSLSPLEREAWRTAALRLRRGLADRVREVLPL